MPIKEETIEGSAGRRHPVPQNVMDVEFKVVGDLTVRQLMYLFAGMSLAYIFHKSGLPAFWRWVFMLLIGGLSVAVAFVPVQERSLDKWLISFIKAMTGPGQRVWRKSYTPPAYFLADYAQIIRNEIITLTPAKSRSKLDEYLGQLPEIQTDIDKYEDMNLKNIHSAFASSTADLPIDIPQSDRLPDMRGTPAVALETQEEPEPSELPEFKLPGIKTSEAKTPEVKTLKPAKKKMDQDEIESKLDFMEGFDRRPVKIDITSPGPIDRALVNLPPELRGEINIATKSKLPTTILTEDVEEIKRQEDKLAKQAGELLEVMKKARVQLKYSADDPSQNEGRIEFYRTKYENISKEREKISEKISQSKGKGIDQDQADNVSLEVKDTVKSLTENNRNLKNKLTQIQSELDFLKDKAKQIEMAGSQSTSTTPADTGSGLAASPIGFNNADPNVITGIVKGRSGDLVEGAVIIIKDGDGDVVRALKTNKLGQFKTQTSLPDGKYTIEVIKGGEKFDIISVKATGKNIPPVYLVAKET